MSAPPKTRPVRRDEGGFTLQEMLIVTAVLVILALVAMPKVLAALEQAKIVKAVQGVKVLSEDVQRYRNVNDLAYPSSLADTEAKQLLDPWYRPYVFVILEAPDNGTPRVDATSQPLNGDFDLYSNGPDGATSLSIADPAGRDDIVRGRSGGFYGKARNY